MVSEQLTIDIIKDILSNNYQIVDRSSIKFCKALHIRDLEDDNHSNIINNFTFSTNTKNDNIIIYNITFDDNLKVILLKCIACYKLKKQSDGTIINMNTFDEYDSQYGIQYIPYGSDIIETLVSNNAELLFESLKDNSKNFVSNSCEDKSNITTPSEEIELKPIKINNFKYLFIGIILGQLLLLIITKLTTPELTQRIYDISNRLVLLILVYLVFKK